MSNIGSPTPAAPLAEQMDEVELLEAMVGRAGEFEWRQEDSGRISGKLQVFLHLEQELDVCVVRREKYVLPPLCMLCVYVYSRTSIAGPMRQHWPHPLALHRRTLRPVAQLPHRCV